MKIVIVEDSKEVQEELSTWLEHYDPSCTSTQLFSVSEAEAFFSGRPDVDLILMDACVPGDSFNTGPLIRSILEWHRGPIVGISGNEYGNQVLREHGCTDAVLKQRARSYLRTFLSQRQS